MTVYLGVLLDFIIGDPKGFPHPVIFIGKLISFYERLLYHQKGKIWGAFLAILVLFTVGCFIQGLLWLCSFVPYLEMIVSTAFICMGLAWKSLKKETAAVADAVAAGDLPEARKRVSYVVGRDTDELTGEEILKADIETVAENTIDGILAPLFYLIIGWFFNFPVLFLWLYKATNTMDSMIGYRNDKYCDFGSFAAKLDDVLNFIPARFGALIMLIAGVIVGCDGKNGWRIFRRDRFAHSSPNSAQSESVIAGLLGLQLGGTHMYFGKPVEKPSIGDPLKSVSLEDFKICCRITDLSVIISMVFFTIVLFFVWMLFGTDFGDFFVK